MFKTNLHIQKEFEAQFSPAENDSESPFRAGLCLEHLFTSISPLHKFQNILWQHTARKHLPLKYFKPGDDKLFLLYHTCKLQCHLFRRLYVPFSGNVSADDSNFRLPPFSFKKLEALSFTFQYAPRHHTHLQIQMFSQESRLNASKWMLSPAFLPHVIYKNLTYHSR